MTTVNTKAFLKELEWAVRFSWTNRNTIPVLANIMLEANEGTLRLTATDLEVSGVSEMTAESAEPMNITVPVKSLIKYLKKVDESTISLRAGENQWLTVSHGDSKVKIGGMAVESFPQLPTIATQGSIQGLTEAIPRALIAVSKEESRFTLNGALFHLMNDTSKVIATDGKRLSLAEIKSNLQGKFLVPTKAVNEVARILTAADSVDFGADENHTQFTVGSRSILARKLTGNFPDYERVLPKSTPHSVLIQVKDTLRLVNRVSTFADERSKAISWSIDGNALTASASISESGSATGKVAVTGIGHDPMEIGFNAAYLMDGLPLTGETCTFGYTNSNSAGLFSVPGFQYLVMPMRI